MDQAIIDKWELQLHIEPLYHHGHHTIKVYSRSGELYSDSVASVELANGIEAAIQQAALRCEEVKVRKEAMAILSSYEGVIANSVPFLRELVKNLLLDHIGNTGRVMSAAEVTKEALTSWMAALTDEVQQIKEDLESIDNQTKAMD